MSVRSKKKEASFDVIVVGGGMTGMCAAIASARHGAKTALVQERPVFGGNASSEIRMHICGASANMVKPNAEETGILREILLENKRVNDYYNYSVWDRVLFTAIREQENLSMFLNTTMHDVETEGHRITAIHCYQMTTEIEWTLRAPVFCDCTGNGTLGFMAGMPFRTGSEGKAEYQEPHAPEQPDQHRMGNTLLFKAVDRGHPVAFVPPKGSYTFTEEQLRYRKHADAKPLFGVLEAENKADPILDNVDNTTKDMVSMERPETGKSYFYIFNFLPYAHEFSNWNVTGVDAQYEPDNWAKAVNSTNFRKAMSLAIDRAEYVTATQGYKPAYSLMNNLYHYDIFNDPTSSYRGSDESMQAICNLYGVKYGEGTPYATLKDAYQSITGYNLTEAKELFATACKELVEAGLYKEGEPIVIRIGWAKGALQSADNKQCEILTKQLNAALEGSGFGTLTLEAVGNINNRYADVANGEYAIGYGAWGGAALYPFRNFQVYCDTDQYDVNEIGCWDPATEMLTLNVNGEDVTMSWKDWSGALIGTGRFTDADFATKLYITAQMEELYLQKYYRIPLAGMTNVSLLSYQVDYYTEDYNLMYGFGGLRLMTFNYSDAEWAEYVAEEGGTLSYE